MKLFQDKDGDKMVLDVIQHFQQYLSQSFGWESENLVEQCDIIILDSSRPDKFSNHLIFPYIVFENIDTLKIFVKFAIEQTNGIFELFSKDGKKKVCFIDQNVYGKNQLFRYDS